PFARAGRPGGGRRVPGRDRLQAKAVYQGGQERHGVGRGAAGNVHPPVPGRLTRNPVTSRVNRGRNAILTRNRALPLVTGRKRVRAAWMARGYGVTDRIGGKGEIGLPRHLEVGPVVSLRRGLVGELDGLGADAEPSEQ